MDWKCVPPSVLINIWNMDIQFLAWLLLRFQQGFFFQCNSWWPSCEFVDYFIISTNVLGSWIGILFVNVWISNLDCWMFAYIRIFSILDTRNILWFIFRTHKLLNECDSANLSWNSLLSDQVEHDTKIFVYLFHFRFSHLWTVGGCFKVPACSLYWQS